MAPNGKLSYFNKIKKLLDECNNWEVLKADSSNISINYKILAKEVENMKEKLDGTKV